MPVPDFSSDVGTNVRQNQPYQVNGFDCGPHTCIMMSVLAQRQTNDIHRTNEVITAPTVQKFRYVLFGHLMKLEKVPIKPGENEECDNDSDELEIL